jgi:two-component system nitrogen regulation sensor histidine kinase NtrY
VTTGKKGGTGLGLAVARRFVEDHGGSLELGGEEDAIASGAHFRLVLPLLSPEVPERAR